jgi:hypothetical protein
MANLKQDLIDQLGRKKYFTELELGRLAQDPNMNYKLKIDLMEKKLQDIAIVNGQIALAQTYFPDPVPENKVPEQVAADKVPVQPAAAQPLPGQSHAE